MSKPKSDQSELQQLDDLFTELDELELWDFVDPADQVFWEEFFKVESALEMSDEFDSPSFTITVQNHQSGEVKTFKNIKLKPSMRKISC